MWDDCRDDAFTFQVALEHLRRDSPPVLYIGLGDTDEHAHNGRYDGDSGPGGRDHRLAAR
jgi:hypothetical protein